MSSNGESGVRSRPVGGKGPPTLMGTSSTSSGANANGGDSFPAIRCRTAGGAPSPDDADGSPGTGRVGRFGLGAATHHITSDGVSLGSPRKVVDTESVNCAGWTFSSMWVNVERQALSLRYFVTMPMPKANSWWFKPSTSTAVRRCRPVTGVLGGTSGGAIGVKFGGEGICNAGAGGWTFAGGTFAGGAVGGIPQSPSFGSLVDDLENPLGGALFLSSSGGPFASATERGAAAGTCFAVLPLVLLAPPPLALGISVPAASVGEGRKVQGTVGAESERCCGTYGYWDIYCSKYEVQSERRSEKSCGLYFEISIWSIYDVHARVTSMGN